MKAITVDDAGNLHWESVPDPELKDGEVMVRVAAAGVNRADLLQRRGRYPAPEGASKILGLEFSGIIEEVGDNVHGWKPGDRVASLIEGGAYAERIAVPASYLLPVPETCDLVKTAAMPEVFLTAFLNIYIEGEAQKGEVVLIHAAASGVGTAALQLCQVLGNPAYATASGSKLKALEPYEPVRCIDRHRESFLDVLRNSEHGGADVILDLVGGSYFTDNIKILRHKGRMITIGLLGGTSASLRLGLLMAKRLRVIGSVLRSRSKEEKAQIIQDFRERVWPLYEEGRIHPVVDSIFPIEDAMSAHEKLRENATIGNVILEVPQS